MTLVHSGIEALGDIKWGTHFCHFYRGQEDLVDTLIPYFKAGLENNEACLWITAEPLYATDARNLLRAAVPGLAEFENKGQIEIIDHGDWYRRNREADTYSTLQLWVERERRALADGYSGLRLTGNTYWLERQDWQAFSEYETQVNETFARHRIVGLCSYCMGRTDASDVFDVVRNHNFALLRERGNWELLEMASVKTAKGELEKLNLGLKANLKTARDAAQSASRLKTEFLANMSHEIRTPLGAILGFTDLLKDETLSADEKAEFIETIQRNGGSLTRLLDDILDIAKVEADRLEIDARPFAINKLIHEVTAMFAQGAQAKKLSLRTEFAADLPALLVSDQARIRQIVVNLLGNAIKFTPAGEVVMRVSFTPLPAATTQPSSTRPHLRFEITDTGIGIPADTQAGLFQAFKQADGSTTRRFGGTGLGLYLSRRLAQALGGDVVLERSLVGQGSVFVATVAVDEFEQTKVIPNPPRAASSNQVLENFRILIVEDIADNRKLLKRMLAPTGADLEFAEDGRLGVDCALSQEFDLILLDLQMPQLDGYGALRELREQGYSKPVIALTAHAMHDERRKVQLAGFDGHLAKPINRQDLIAALTTFRKKALLSTGHM